MGARAVSTEVPVQVIKDLAIGDGANLRAIAALSPTMRALIEQAERAMAQVVNLVGATTAQRLAGIITQEAVHPPSRLAIQSHPVADLATDLGELMRDARPIDTIVTSPSASLTLNTSNGQLTLRRLDTGAWRVSLPPSSGPAFSFGPNDGRSYDVPSEKARDMALVVGCSLAKFADTPRYAYAKTFFDDVIAGG